MNNMNMDNMNMDNMKVTIIGLGLIGGSLARALKERLGIRDITAVTPNRQDIDAAIKDQVICRGFTQLNDHVYNSDIIFICTPVKYTYEYISCIAGKVKADCIVTDVGSTKSDIIGQVNSMASPPCFIGGHPMAGKEKNGYSSGAAHLFENAYYILSPSRSTTPQAMSVLKGIIEGIGAIPVVLDAKEHDRITGGISHVPHIIASALVNLVKDMETPDGKMQMLAAGGFRDITRIASSSPEVWESIVLSNRMEIKRILEHYIEILNRFSGLMEQKNSAGLYHFFEDAKHFRDSIPAGKPGLIAPIYELIVDVVDKPGIIGEIATILGDSGINIKNINVSNSREFEQGCLKITLPDPASVDAAGKLLADKGYRVYK
ncbi:prephenate dehydrogenase [Pseudoclostridium thermosuccinogenes]|jgi:prephenate dehydrogenase|uniref:prephenate dehydrogenase n=1 Tax=Clostridium thermosuccinogenes TaxID=84032 RepID=UPI002FD9F330